MTKRKNLTSVLKLLDDESPVVKHAVSEELKRYGPRLVEEIQRLEAPPGLEERKSLQSMFQGLDRDELKKHWQSWFGLEGTHAKLEKACDLIAQFQTRFIYPETLAASLDRLAQEYDNNYVKRDAYKLAHFLFKKKGIRRTTLDQHHPFHWNLVYAIREKQGAPAILVCLYMLVGRRLGLEIEGCDFPGHLLAKVRLGGAPFFVDCDHGGRFVDKNELEFHADAGMIEEALCQRATAETILKQMLHHLCSAYQEKGEGENASLLAELLKAVERNKAAKKGATNGTYA